MVNPHKLTPAQIDAMPAGREMDALVAETIEPMPDAPDDPDGELLSVFLAGTNTMSPGKGWWLVFYYEHGDVPEWVPRWWSKDIAAAWHLADILAAGPYYVVIKPDEDGGWLVDVSRDGEGGWRWLCCGRGETAPLALCRAFLKAKLLEVGA